MFGPMMIPNYGGLLGEADNSFLRNQGLLSLAANLLAASGPSPHKVSFGQALGQGLQGFQQGQQAGMQGLLNQRKLAEFDSEQKRQKGLLDLVGTKGEKIGATPFDDEGNQMHTGTGLLGALDRGDPNALRDYYAQVAAFDPKLGIAGLTKLQDHQQGRGEYYVPVDTPQGVMAFDSRRGVVVNPFTGQAVSSPIVKSQSDPKLQGDIARSREYGKNEGELTAQREIKKPQQATDTLSMLTEAEKLIDKSTGSLGGTVVDAVTGSVGYSTEGAKAAAQLKVLQAGLMTNMPRMEGPQSDRDVDLYREAAGKIGDPMVPNETKKAAVQIIRTINEKYASRGKGQTQPTAPEIPTRVRRFNPATGKIE